MVNYIHINANTGLLLMGTRMSGNSTIEAPKLYRFVMVIYYKNTHKLKTMLYR